MKIALTGANGFLGAYIVKEFLANGYQVVALVRASANCDMLPNHDDLSIETINYRSELKTQFAELKNKHGDLTCFIHNAGVTVSLDNDEYFEINAHLTQTIVEAVTISGWLPKGNKLVYVSSMAAQGPYGVGKPVSNYGRSKLEAEKFFRESPFPYLLIRPTGIYGAGDLAFLPLFKLASKGIYPMTSSKQKMSMIHAGDLAKIIRIESENSEGIIHTNDGHTYLHSDFIKTLERTTGKKLIRIPTPKWVSKLSLGLSDIWHKLINKRPGLTLEKFQEITMDWHLHENPELTFSKVPCSISLEEGFKNAYHFYQTKNLL